MPVSTLAKRATKILFNAIRAQAASGLQSNDCEKIVVLTGAGCSTDSGIPDYRSPGGSYSKGHKPMQHMDYVTSVENRKRYWARSIFGWQLMDSAAPCSTHRAITDLQNRGLVRSIVTQNVDSLHSKAGSRNVLELHGNLQAVSCLSCGFEQSRTHFQRRVQEANTQWLQTNLLSMRHPDRIRSDGDVELGPVNYSDFDVPACPACGGVLMPTLVFFGGSVKPEVRQQALETVESAAALLVLGSSVQVFSAFRLCRAASQKQVPIVIVNDGVTRADPIADLKVDARLGPFLNDLLLCLDASAVHSITDVKTKSPK